MQHFHSVLDKHQRFNFLIFFFNFLLLSLSLSVCQQQQKLGQTHMNLDPRDLDDDELDTASK